jgi:hypothetical protein
MNAMNFNEFQRGEVRGGSYRLLTEPAQLRVRMEHVPSADELQWEDDGGPAVELVTEMTVEEYHKQQMRLRGARKQSAARIARPFESSRIVKVAEPAPMRVVAVRLRGGSERDEQIAALEAQVEVLLGLVRAPIVAAERKAESIKRLESLFNGLRTRV